MFQLRGYGLGDAAHDFCIGVPGLDAADFQHCVDQYRREQASGGQVPTVSTQPTSVPTIPSIPIPSIPGITTPVTPGTTATVTTPGLFSPGWYKTPFGLALIAVGAFAGYKLYTRKKPA